jgi:hypothetical protein
MAHLTPDPNGARWDDRDVIHVVRALHRWGPQSLPDLVDDPELAGWPAQRVEHAVVTAWAQNVIFVDTRSLLVAL